MLRINSDLNASILAKRLPLSKATFSTQRRLQSTATRKLSSEAPKKTSTNEDNLSFGERFLIEVYHGFKGTLLGSLVGYGLSNGKEEGALLGAGIGLFCYEWPESRRAINNAPKGVKIAAAAIAAVSTANTARIIYNKNK